MRDHQMQAILRCSGTGRIPDAFSTTVRLRQVGRGLGSVQRFVLAALDASSERDPFTWVSARTLAADRAAGEPTRAQIETINRALRTLARRGLAELGFVWTSVPTRRPASSTGRMRVATAAARRPPTPEQVERARRERTQRVESLRSRLETAGRDGLNRRRWWS
jgi:hypothetical protein